MANHPHAHMERIVREAKALGNKGYADAGTTLEKQETEGVQSHEPTGNDAVCMEKPPLAHARKTGRTLQKRLFHASQRGEGQALHRLQRRAMISRAHQSPGRKDGHTRQQRKKDRRGRRREITHPRRTSQAGRQHAKKRHVTPKEPRCAACGFLNQDDRKNAPWVFPRWKRERGRHWPKSLLNQHGKQQCDAHSCGFRPGRAAHDAIRLNLRLHRRSTRSVRDAASEKGSTASTMMPCCTSSARSPGSPTSSNDRAKPAWSKGIPSSRQKKARPKEGYSPHASQYCPPWPTNSHGNGMPSSPRIHPYTKERIGETRRFQWAPKVVRYADDFLIIAPRPQSHTGSKAHRRNMAGTVGMKTHRRQNQHHPHPDTGTGHSRG